MQRFTLIVSLALAAACGRGLQPNDHVELTLAAAPSSQTGVATLDVLSVEGQINGTWTTLSTATTVASLTLGERPSAASLGPISLPPGELTGVRLTLASGTLRASTKRAGHDSDDVTATASCNKHVPPCATGQLALQIEDLIQYLEQTLPAGPKLDVITSDLEQGICPSDLGSDLQTKDAAQSLDLASAPDLADPACVGVVCPPGQICHGGSCVPNDSCIGVVCAPGQVCQDGACVAAPDLAGSTANLAHAADLSEPVDLSLPDDHHACAVEREPRGRRR